MNLKVTVDSGIYVAKVEKGSPADIAGIRSGDIITKLANEKVGSMAKLRQVMYNLDVGNQVDIEIRRDGRVFTKKIAPSKATM